MLKLDSGEGRYYTESLGPVNGMMEFKTRQDQIHSGANVLYTSGQGVFSGEDLVSSMYCSSIIIKRWNMFKLLLPSWEGVDLYKSYSINKFVLHNTFLKINSYT
ncbi:hypothetical protein DPMN_007509 [Dreissena polymorpha]|uniref:Uncharacterized protein n=1 Tax=Dreissena polymorpha TaxID=45954 RepID=A0A9D4MUG3_DREPO|nr:hypothetical protein DPMN_007509 [Dreissena polymorpha]